MQVQRAQERFSSHGDGWVGHYCFSYGEHYDPANVSFGRMLACNDFVLQPGAGFGRHRHAGLDIVTVVLDGTLTHVTDSEEPRPPGSYLLRTGAGVEHDERNDTDAPVRFLQVWLTPGTTDPRPHVHTTADGPKSLQDKDFVLATGPAAIAGVVLEPGDSVRLDAPAILTGDALVFGC